MKLFVVRHGETQFNAEHRYLGALDPELTAHGRAQAIALRDVLPSPVDAVVCSPLLRARQTAEIAFQGSHLFPVVMPAFRERHVGVFEGLTQDEARTQFPDLWKRNITRLWHEAPPDGETIAEMIARVSSGLQELGMSHAGKNVVLIAHGFVAKVIRAISLNNFEDFFDWKLSNGEFFEASNNFPAINLQDHLS